MRAYLDTVDSPAGKVSFAVDEKGRLVRVRFSEGDYKRNIEEELEAEGFVLGYDRSLTANVSEELLEYNAGERRSFDVFPVSNGTVWQKAVWTALMRIPYGETRTYSEIAAMIGHPKAARAVGRANATNRVPIVVPCHRVVGADGTLTGFAGGTHLKERLLEHERRVVAGSEMV